MLLLVRSILLDISDEIVRTTFKLDRKNEIIENSFNIYMEHKVFDNVFKDYKINEKNKKNVDDNLDISMTRQFYIYKTTFK